MLRPLPTGNELMSGPIVDGGLTRQEKEIMFVMDNIDKRIKSLKNDEQFQTYKWTIFSIAVFLAMGGVTLILFGLHLTFFFEKYDDNMVAVVFGAIMCCPVFYWFYYVFLPSKEEKRRRRRIYIDRKDRRKPTLFNQLVEEAKAHTEPPPRRIRLIAHIRKHDYPIVGTTMGDFADAVANQSGIAIERQLLRFNDTDLEIHVDEKLDEFYGLDDNDRIYVYNKGGYFTNNSPLKKARVDIMHMNEFTDDARTNVGSRGGTAGGSRPSFSQGGRGSTIGNSMNGLKSAFSDTDGRDSMGGRESFSPEKKKNVNVSWKS